MLLEWLCPLHTTELLFSFWWLSAVEASAFASELTRHWHASCTRPLLTPFPSCWCLPAQQGKDYLAAEHARLNRVIESGSVAASKLDEMSAKVSVLSAFTGKEEAPAAEQKEEEEDDDDDVDEE